MKKSNTTITPPHKNKALGLGATILALGSVLSSTSIANAATFNFSFSNVNGNTPGTVEGMIELPDGDFMNLPATSVMVTSAPAGLGYTTPVDILGNGTIGFGNSFTVVGGIIDTAASNIGIAFNVGTPEDSVFSLSFPGFGSLLGENGIPITDGKNGVVDVNDTTLVFSNKAVGTPEPTSMITLIGVGVLGVASKKLKKKA